MLFIMFFHASPYISLKEWLTHSKSAYWKDQSYMPQMWDHNTGQTKAWNGLKPTHVYPTNGFISQQWNHPCSTFLAISTDRAPRGFPLNAISCCNGIGCQQNRDPGSVRSGSWTHWPLGKVMSRKGYFQSFIFKYRWFSARCALAMELIFLTLTHRYVSWLTTRTTPLKFCYSNWKWGFWMCCEPSDLIFIIYLMHIVVNISLFHYLSIGALKSMFKMLGNSWIDQNAPRPAVWLWFSGYSFGITESVNPFVEYSQQASFKAGS